MKELQTVLNNILTDKNTNLKPENLKKGVTCLGVTGTLEASTTSGGVKQFSTVEEMNSSTGNTEGDLAIVCGNTLVNMVVDTETQYVTFPDTVVLPTAVTRYYNTFDALRAVDSSVSFAPQVTLSKTLFVFDYSDEWDEYTIRVEYTSVDGITYTRSTTITNPVDLGTVVKPYVLWDDNLGYFIKVGSLSFTGLYKYSGTAWELAPTDLNTTADEVYLTKFYGKNGLEVGTLQNIENLSKDNINTRVKLWNIFNSGMVCPSDVSVMFNGCTNLQTIPLLDTSSVTNMAGMFQDCTNLQTIPLLDTSSVTKMNSMFYHCRSLTTIPLLDTSNVTDMSYMFDGCTNLTTIPLLNTSSAISMAHMFNNCQSLTTIPLLDTSAATNIYNMFDSCTSLSDDSLNNVLTMCTNATAYTGTKTLKNIGLTSDQATKCATLSNYSTFTAAGWTTGY